MRPELRKEMLRLLQELSNSESSGVLPLTFGTSALTLEAVRLLEDIGAVSRMSGGISITSHGYTYLQKSKFRPALWIRDHMIPLVVSLLLAIAAAVAASLTLRLLG